LVDDQPLLSPGIQDGAFTSTTAISGRFALGKTLRNNDLAASLGAKTYVCWGGREGAESDAATDVRVALDRYKGRSTRCAGISGEQGYDLAGAGAKRTSPRGDIFLPRLATRWRSFNQLEFPTWSGSTRGRPETMAGLEFRARRGAGAVVGQALPRST